MFRKKNCPKNFNGPIRISYVKSERGRGGIHSDWKLKLKKSPLIRAIISEKRYYWDVCNAESMMGKFSLLWISNVKYMNWTSYLNVWDPVFMFHYMYSIFDGEN